MKTLKMYKGLCSTYRLIETEENKSYIITMELEKSENTIIVKKTKLYNEACAIFKEILIDIL